MIEEPTADDLMVAKDVALSSIPMIDFAPFLNGAHADRERVARAIRQACETIGFFYLTGHGVPDALRAAMFEHSADFFHLPPEEKETLRATTEWNRGWIHSDDRSNLNASSRIFEQYRIQREFDPADEALKSGNPLFQPNRWPNQIPGFRRDTVDYYDRVSEVGRQLVRAMSMGLGLPEDRLERYFNRPICQISLMYYPALPDGVGNEIKNLSAHTDEAPVVILAQGDIGGLEVKNLDGEWLSAPPVPGAFTVNIGNMMMWWSNGRYKSTLHRVRNTSRRERISIPFFWNADPETVVQPLEELVARDGVSRYAPVEVGPLMSRFYKSAVYVPFEGHER